MRAVYLTDGSETAFFAATFQAWKKPNAFLSSQKHFQPTLTDEICRVFETDEDSREQTARVCAAVRKIDERALREVHLILISAAEEKEQIAYLYLKELFKSRSPVREKLQLSAVRNAVDVCRSIGKEAEHLKGFLRFKETAFSVYYAACSPDNDILPLLAPHFIARLQLPFILHDVSRGYALCYGGYSGEKSENGYPVQGENARIRGERKQENGGAQNSITQGGFLQGGATQSNRVRLGKAGSESVWKIEAKEASVSLSENEEAIAALWKSYYETVAIRARKNEKLQDRLMPRRYRKFMDETKEPPQ